MQTLIRTLLCVALVGSLVAAQSRADDALLHEVSKRHRENWNAVQSWRGEVEIVDENTDPAVRFKDAKWWSKVSFAYQASPHLVRWNWRMVKSENAEIPIPISNGLIKDEVATVLEVHTPKGETKERRDVRILDLESLGLGPHGQMFSPMYFTGYRGDNLADWFDHVAGWFEKLDPAELKGWDVSQKGDLFILSFVSPTLLNCYTADLSKGGNLVSYEAEEREDSVVVSKGHWVWKYEQLDGVWLPANLTISKFEFARAGGDQKAGTELSRSVRTITWTTNEINVPMENEFMLEAIGLVKGDLISNTITGEYSRYGMEGEPAFPIPEGQVCPLPSPK